MDDNSVSEVKPSGEATLSKKERKAILYRERIINAPSNDMKYRGPLNVNGLKAIGWSLFVIGYISTLLSIGGRLGDPTLAAISSSFLPTFLSALASISVPCFLLGRFGIIFQRKNGYKRLIIQYGFCALLVCIGFFAIYLRYVVTIVQTLQKISYAEALEGLNDTFANIFGKKITFNLFIDLFIYSTFITFACYENKKWEKWKLYLFRSCTIIPILYVTVGFIFRLLHSLDHVALPVYLMPIMPTNTPISFLIFVIIIVAIKLRERKFEKMGGTNAEYIKYSLTKRNSWFFAKNASLAFLIGGVIDIIVSCIFTAYLLSIYPINEPNTRAIITSILSSAGLGDTISYIIFSPIVLLYSYNRVHKSSVLDFIIPSTAIALIVFITIEFGFQAFVGIINRSIEGAKGG